MDIKIKGLSKDILYRALKQARKAYLYILEKMTNVIAEPRPELSPYAPRIFIMHIDPDKIRDVIGPGGKMINKITQDTETEIEIEPDGKIYIAAVNPENGRKAMKIIESLTRDVEVGEIYIGKITRVENYGAFAEILPGKEGLIHISRLSHEHVERTEDVLNIGDETPVKVIGIDERGRIDLSRRAAIPNEKGEMIEEEMLPRREAKREFKKEERRGHPNHNKKRRRT